MRRAQSAFSWRINEQLEAIGTLLLWNFIRFWALELGAPMVDILERQIEFVFPVFWIAATLLPRLVRTREGLTSLAS
jgi:hypothetical protein